MLKSANNTDESVIFLKNMLSSIPRINHIKLHGVYNVLVPPNWKEENQNNYDQHLLLITGGKGFYYLDDKIIELKRGVIVFISNNCIHNAKINTTHPLTLIPMRFGFYSNETKQHQPVNSPFSLWANLDITTVDYYESKFLEFYHKINYTEETILKEFIAQIFISEILYMLLKKQNLNDKNTRIDTRIEQARIIIDENKNRNISVPNIAVKVGLSERHLRKLFKEHYRISPKKYHLKSRLQYAKYLLSETNYTIKEIAYMVGYSDAYVFSKQYKEFYGIPPSQQE